jgi:hypothetical protein
VEILQLDVAIEAAAEFAKDPFAGAVVDVATAEVDEENDAGAYAEQSANDVRPKAKSAYGFRHQMPVEKMLMGGEKFRMGGSGIGGVCGYGDRGVDVEGDWREADFVAAGLVAEL